VRFDVYAEPFALGEAAAVPMESAVDVLLSVFGVIFAPDPVAAAAEMARVQAPTAPPCARSVAQSPVKARRSSASPSHNASVTRLGALFPDHCDAHGHRTPPVRQMR
jgi:hypothetical protein